MNLALICILLGSFRGGTRGNAVSIVKVFKNALWTALRTIFWPKCTRFQDFAYTVSKFSGVIPADRNIPVAWTQTPIFAWLASVTIVPALRNDHWCADSGTGQDSEDGELKDERVDGAKSLATTLRGSEAERVNKALAKIDEKKKKRSARQEQVGLSFACGSRRTKRATLCSK